MYACILGHTQIQSLPNLVICFGCRAVHATKKKNGNNEHIPIYTRNTFAIESAQRWRRRRRRRRRCRQRPKHARAHSNIHKHILRLLAIFLLNLSTLWCFSGLHHEQTSKSERENQIEISASLRYTFENSTQPKRNGYVYTIFIYIYENSTFLFNFWLYKMYFKKK